MRIKPQSVGIIHFVGIGGIGMSGIAEILLSLGYVVQGSDQSENTNVQRLRRLGVPVCIGHDALHVREAAVVVISSAVQSDNPEVVEARRLLIPVVRRADMLAELMRLKPSIAVAGTHGKTTTTSLGACVLEGADLDPTVVSGGIINSYGTNARLGAGEWIIVEADESDGTFTTLPATIAIVTNIEPEHMEHYGTVERLHGAFKQFLENLPFYGLGIVCADQEAVMTLRSGLTDRRIVTYGFSEKADVRATNIKLGPEGATFDVSFSEHFFLMCKNAPQVRALQGIRLNMFGEHNIQNALSILALAYELGLAPDRLLKGFREFKGVHRRFTKTGEAAGITIIDDYAHHPTEIKAVLKTARTVCSGKTIAIVQPHRYTRWRDLYQDFLTCFGDADIVGISSFYSAGEAPIDGIDHLKFVSDLQKVHTGVVFAFEGQEDLTGHTLERAQEGDFVICMGAGSITSWAHKLPQYLEQASEPVKYDGTYN